MTPPASDQRQVRREKLFRETPGERLQRIVAGTLRALQPNRIGSIPFILRFMCRDMVSANAALPDALSAPTVHDGICGIVRDLSVETLRNGFRSGIYVAAHAGPVKWWSPPQRCVLSPADFHIPKRLRARLRQGQHTVTFDRDFEAVIKACAARRPGKWPVTWITPKIMHAFAAWHDAGEVHSFEVWDRQGELVGGGYGVALGGIFIIESQFAREDNASKIGFCVLNWHLAKWGFALVDNKGPARHLLEMGFRLVPRARFLAQLPDVLALPGRSGHWQAEAGLATVAAWQPQQGRPGATAVAAE
jgi:leucyl/phenylalanyl-tRNA--protein transferase